ncbi:MAG: NADH-quinone oxidoreductase subunit J [Actinomycetota bacterium]
MELFVFIVAGAMVIGGGLGVVLSKHPVHSALSLVLTLFGVAVLFVAQQANFLAAVQVIVYAGAIVVLFLFVIMLLGVDNAENLSIEPFRIQRPLAAVVGVGTFVLVVTAAIVARGADVAVRGSGLEVAGANGADHDGNIKALARDLFSDHVLAFELTSVLLVIAVVGTVVLARKPRKGELKVGEA